MPDAAGSHGRIFSEGLKTVDGIASSHALQNCMRIPLNHDSDGAAHCIKAGYYKMGWTNFMREWGGRKTGSSQRQS